MPSAVALRTQIDSFLESRFPAALTPAPRMRDVAATGIKEMDALLNGGLPVGAICELAGPMSSGRTSLALSFVARRTAESRVCAWVDVHDSLDPASAAANGVALSHLLWIRCREEQRQPDRGNRRPGQHRVWARLDQALRATDLLLQAGGFAAIVLDLGSTAPEHARRIPLATWFRFRQAADRTRTSLVVLGQEACAESSAAVVLECEPLRAKTAGATVLRGFAAHVRRGRERFSPLEIGTKKPPASTWSAEAQWQMEKRA
jgi:recombination protein RecA